MKTLLLIILAGGIGFGAAYVVFTSRGDATLKSELARREAQWQAEMESLESQLAEARNQEQMIRHVETQVAVATSRSAEEILKNLHQLRPAGATRITTIRKIIHELEDLAQLKEQALPSIRDFLSQNTDLEYTAIAAGNDSDSDRGRWTPPWSRSTPQTEFTLPPSLRIGLFDVLKEIGGTNAEQVLAEVMGSSGRAVEVAYLARILEEMAPGKYRDLALAAARDLLRNPVAIDSPNRLDEQAEGYLYGILELFGDASFVDEARKVLVGADGRLNRNAQHYLTRVLGNQVVGTYYEAYKSNTVSNTWDRVSIANRILDFAGENPQSNQFISEVVADTNIDSRMRSFAVMRLAGGFGGVESPTDPNVIRARIQLVDTMKQGVTEERLVQTLDTTRKNLQNLLEGRPVENNWGGRGRGDRGDQAAPPAPAN